MSLRRKKKEGRGKKGVRSQKPEWGSVREYTPPPSYLLPALLNLGMK